MCSAPHHRNLSHLMVSPFSLWPPFGCPGAIRLGSNEEDVLLFWRLFHKPVWWELYSLSTTDSFGFDLNWQFTLLLPVRVGGPYVPAALHLGREPGCKGDQLFLARFEGERAAAKVLAEQDGLVLRQLHINSQRVCCCRTRADLQFKRNVFYLFEETVSSASSHVAAVPLSVQVVEFQERRSPSSLQGCEVRSTKSNSPWFLLLL